MTWEEFIEYADVHSECAADQTEWYEYDESESDHAGMCPACGCEFTLVNYDPGARTTLFECKDCGAMWDQWGGSRD